MGPYSVRYSDLLTFCPQWHDIFVAGSLAFETIDPAPRILDCGANIGLASLFFRRQYPDARVTAFEADPALFAILNANLHANGAGSVETRHVALWTSTGTLTFQCEGSDSGRISTLPGASEGRATTVPSLRLRDVLDEGPVDLLKLDIEGAEAEVLADCEPVLHRVKALVMDLHEFDPSVRQTPRVLELLAIAGFSYAIDDFVPLPWRGSRAGADTPFPGRAMQWAMTVRAWRP
jgi:FkbM family methyltransferase